MDNYPTSGDSLHGRTVSGFPLSIGTGLSFETLFPVRQKVYDETRVAPPHADVSKYSECWINLATMFRNLQSSINKETFLKADPGELAEVLVSEMGVIESLFQVEGNGTCKPIFYYCTYEKFTRQAPKEIKFRKDNTQNQILYTDTLGKTLKEIEKQTEVVRKLDSELPAAPTTNGLIFTHVPADLLNFPRFRSLELLESHTGLVKKRQQWGTKYHSMAGRDMSILPFMRKLYMIFGDRVLLYPNDLKLRNAILDCAEKRGWTGYTTESKVMLDLGLDIKEMFVLEFLRKL
jgi:hypothetical protein